MSRYGYSDGYGNNSGNYGNPNNSLDSYARRSQHQRAISDKPRLKYNSNISAGTVNAVAKLMPSATTTPVTNGVRQPTVPLFDQAELQYLKQQVSSYSSPVNSLLASTSLAYKPQLLSAYTFLTSNTTTAVVLNNSPALTANTVNKVSKNPYNHPLSAKDLQQSDQMYITPAVLLGSAAPVNRTPTTSNVVNNNNNTYSVGPKSIIAPSPTPPVQTNSFMRPQSAFRTDSTNAARHTPSRSMVIPANSPPTMVVETKPIAVVKREHNSEDMNKLYMSKSHAMTPACTSPVQIVPKPPASKPTYLRINSASSMSHRQSTQMTNVWPKDAFVQTTTVSVVTNTPSDSNNNKPKLQSKPEASMSKSSIPCPGSAVRMQQNTVGVSVTGSRPPSVSSHSSASRLPPSGHTQRQTSSGTSGGYSTKPPLNKPAAANLRRTNSVTGGPLSNVKVRNLNYTPTKPYSDVCNPDSQSPTPDNISRTNSPDSLNTSEGSQNSRATPTVFYKKGSRAEEVLHDVLHRPKADGAASPQKTKEEKGGSGAVRVPYANQEDTEEWEDVDEEEDDTTHFNGINR